MGFEVRERGASYEPGGMVLDNSVVMRWVVESGSAEDREYAGALRSELKSTRFPVLVPYLWVYEASNVISQYIRQKKLQPQLARSALESLYAMCMIRVERENPVALLELADSHGITPCDAAYLLLARTEALPLATLDKAMRTAARKMGIPVYGDPV